MHKSVRRAINKCKPYQRQVSCGGENIYPREMEEFLYAHPEILDGHVIGVPDEKYGEEMMAWV